MKSDMVVPAVLVVTITVQKIVGWKRCARTWNATLTKKIAKKTSVLVK